MAHSLPYCSCWEGRLAEISAIPVVPPYQQYCDRFSIYRENYSKLTVYSNGFCLQHLQQHIIHVLITSLYAETRILYSTENSCNEHKFGVSLQPHTALLLWQLLPPILSSSFPLPQDVAGAHSAVIATWFWQMNSVRHQSLRNNGHNPPGV